MALAVYAVVMAAGVLWFRAAKALDVAEVQVTQKVINDLQTDGTVRFQSLGLARNDSAGPLREYRFVNSDMVHVERMSANGRSLSFQVEHRGKTFSYVVPLNGAVPPGQSALLKIEGYTTGQIRWLPSGEQEYVQQHWPANGLNTLHIDTYRLPSDVRLIETAPADITLRRLADGRLELHTEKIIPPNGSMTVRIRFQQPPPGWQPRHGAWKFGSHGGAAIDELSRWAHQERFFTVLVKLYMKTTYRIVNVTCSALAAARLLWGVLLCCGMPVLTSSCAVKENLPPRAGAHPHERASYDFRQTPAYRQLSGEEKKKLEAVHRDFMLLAGALAVYYADHDRMLPLSLDALVPKYLTELPRDPFAATPSPQERQSAAWTPSAGGLGYDYAPGSAGNWAWRLRSAGLPEFPYATASSKGIHLLMGEWISGRNPIRQSRSDR